MQLPSAHTQAPSPILVVGPGRMGRAIDAAAREAGIETDLTDRSRLETACEDATIVLLCVPDSAIEAACATVVAGAPALRLIGHTSGASCLAALDGAGSAAGRFSLHPLQSVTDASPGLAGAPAAVAGSTSEALAFAADLAGRLGMGSFEVPDEARAAYHAAASIASNFLVALEESAAGLLRDAGIDNGRELLAPLVLRTAVNWADAGGGALTGPIARGDEATVDRHLEAIAATSPELTDLYRALAERTRELAVADRGARA